MNKEKRTIKIEHFSNLVAVAMADGFLDKEEINFLKEKAEEVQIPEDKVKELIENADKLKFTVPLNSEEREEQLSDIVYMMLVDGNINENEYKLCLNIATKLGLTQKDLDHVVKLTKKLWALE